MADTTNGAKGANIPDPKLPSKGKVSRLAGRTIYANPKLNGVNPRQEGTHGFRVHEIVRKAGAAGIRYEDLAKAVKADETIKGFSNHLAWDIERFFILVK